MPFPRVAELTDLPRCDPNLSAGSVFKAQARKGLVVVYESQGPGWPDSEHWAVVCFSPCACVVCGGPNDEALGNHPLFASGLRFYTLQEVIDSPWLAERCRIQDKDANPHPPWWLGRCRHFVLAFKENTVEVMAERYELLGQYVSRSVAMESVFVYLRGDA